MAVNGSNPKRWGIRPCPCCDSPEVYRKAGTNSRHALTITDRRKQEAADSKEEESR